MIATLPACKGLCAVNGRSFITNDERSQTNVRPWGWKPRPLRPGVSNYLVILNKAARSAVTEALSKDLEDVSAADAASGVLKGSVPE